MGLPARCYDSLSEVYTEPKPSFLRKYGSRIVGGLACAFVVSLIMHLTPVIEGIRWLGEGIRWSLGRPAPLARRHDPRPMGKRIEVAIEKVREIASEHEPPKPAPKAIPKVIAPVVTAAIAAPVVKKIEAIEKRIDNGKKNVANGLHDMADATRTGVTKIEKRIIDHNLAKDRAKYDQLVVHARAIGVKVDDTWSVARLEAEVNQAEDIVWRKRWNAQCPRCHHPQRIRESAKRENLQCLHCLGIFYGARARALGAPPRPQPGGGWRLPF
jgi:hypothetical protein